MDLTDPLKIRMTTMLRMPRGLWADLETTIIQQDRQFLTEVARALGLPVADVIKRCLGTGAPQAVLVGETETDPCPWWNKIGYLWKPCGRARLTATTPCPVHTHSKPSPTLCLGSDDQLAAVEVAKPFIWNGDLYWCAESSTVREDGIAVPFSFKQIEHRGKVFHVKIDE